MYRQLEIKTAFTGSIRQSLDPAMIQIATPVENHLANTFAFGKFGDLQPDLTRLLGFPFNISGNHPFIQSGHGSQSISSNIVYNLAIDMFCAFENTQSRSLRSSGNIFPDPFNPLYTSTLFRIYLTHCFAL